MKLSEQCQGSSFFYKKILNTQKAPKRKTNDFHPIRSFCTRKKLLLLLFNVCLILFYWLIFASECFCVFKNINWLEIVLLETILLRWSSSSS